jgi:hypothetical protein
MTADQYLLQRLAAEAVDTGPYSPVRSVQTTLTSILSRWAAGYLNTVEPSGSFAKGTANASGTDIDLFLSLSSTTPNTLKEIYTSLFNAMQGAGYVPRAQTVSIGVRVGTYDVDLVPAKRQDQYGSDHSLYRSKKDSWTKTNVVRHIALVSGSGRTNEIRLLKLWRQRHGLDFPSFYLELVAIDALHRKPVGALADNTWAALTYIRDNINTARFVDPANSANIISDDLTSSEKATLAAAAGAALKATNWSQIVG